MWFFNILYRVFVILIINNSFIGCFAQPQSISLPDHSSCYREIGNNHTYFPINFEAKLLSPPYLTACISVHVQKFKDQIQPQNFTFLYLEKVKEKCPHAFVFSNAGFQHDIDVSVSYYVGYRSYYELDGTWGFVSHSIKPGLVEFSTKTSLIKTYLYYQPNMDDVMNFHPRLSADEILPFLDQRLFDANFLCLYDGFKIFVIEPNFGNDVPVFPKFQWIYVRLYSNGKPIYVMAYPGWPCNEAASFYDVRKTVFVVENRIKNPKIYITFGEYGTQRNRNHLSLQELKNGIYFQTLNKIKRFGQYNDWLIVRDALYIANQYRMALTQCEESIWIIKAGDINLRAYEQKWIDNPASGLKSFHHQLLDALPHCEK